MIQKLLLSILFSCLFLSLLAQEKINEHLYPFNSKYLNIKTLQYENLNEEQSHHFKTDSKYAMRYKGLVMDKIAYKGMLFESLGDNGLLLKNLETKAATPLSNKEKSLPTQGHPFLLEVTKGIVFIKPLQAENGYMVYKYDETGKELFGVQIPHSEFVQHGELSYHLPYLGYTTHTATSVIFSSYVNRIPKTIMLNTLDGSIVSFDFSCIGVIRDENMDMDIHGFIQLDKSKNVLNINYISQNFSIERSYFSNITHVETLVLGNTLVLAAYNGRTPDAHLFAVDLKKEQIIWEAEVASFGGTASNTYFNAIWLGVFEGKILLEGYESKGKYLQVFDSSTGKRLWKSF